MTSVCDNAFHNDQAVACLRSAEEVVPYILELSRAKTVVDVGCGVGTWLSTYKKRGANVVFGIDGTWVNLAKLLSPQDCFLPVDVFNLPEPTRRFDLAQSLETAEHLPDSHARSFVELLTRLSDVVVFSAASTRHRGVVQANERWPDYWREEFDKLGYALFDVFRPRYAQDMFLYVQREHRLAHELTRDHGEGWKYPERIVHPGRIALARAAKTPMHQVDCRKEASAASKDLGVAVSDPRP